MSSVFARFAAAMALAVCCSPLHAEGVKAPASFFTPVGAAAPFLLETLGRHPLAVASERPTASESPRPSLPEPEAVADRDLSVTRSLSSDAARFEIGALGGGRREAPSLLHVGLGLDF